MTVYQMKLISSYELSAKNCMLFFAISDYNGLTISWLIFIFSLMAINIINLYKKKQCINRRN